MEQGRSRYPITPGCNSSTNSTTNTASPRSTGVYGTKAFEVPINGVEKKRLHAMTATPCPHKYLLLGCSGVHHPHYVHPIGNARHALHRALQHPGPCTHGSSHANVVADREARGIGMRNGTKPQDATLLEPAPKPARISGRAPKMRGKLRRTFVAGKICNARKRNTEAASC